MEIMQIVTETKKQFDSGNSVIWKGDPGGGKTYQSKRLFEHYRDEGKKVGEKWGLCRMFMATKTATDFDGLPWKGVRVFEMRDGTKREVTFTDPAIPTWAMCEPDEDGIRKPFFCYDKIMLIIEEWGQGELDAKRAGANLFAEKGTGNYYLPKGSHVLALTNIDSRDGITKEFNFVIRRRGEYIVTPSAKSWLHNFAEHPYEHEGKIWQVSPETCAWASQNENLLFSELPKVQGPWANPSTVTSMDRYKQTATKYNNGITPVDDPAFIQSVAGWIGHDVGKNYINFLQSEVELPAFELVLKDPLACPVPKRLDLKLLMIYKLSGNVEPKQLQPVIQYLSRRGDNGFPADMSTSFVTTLLRRDYDAFYNLPVMQAWVTKNAALLGLLGSLRRHN